MAINLPDVFVSADEEMNADFFNKRFTLIVGAINEAKALASVYGTTSQQLLTLGLTQINAALAPIISQLSNATTLGFLLGKSISSIGINIGDDCDLVISDDGSRELFQPTPFLTIMDNNHSDKFATLQLVSYDRLTGVLQTVVQYVNGGGTLTGSDWTVSASGAELQAMWALVTSVAGDAASADADASTSSASAASVLANWNSFRNQYLGTYASDPTVTPTGGALAAGMLYSTTAGLLKVYGGSSWASYAPATAAVTSFNTRTGAVNAAANDYTFAQLASKPTTLSGYGITDSVELTSNKGATSGYASLVGGTVPLAQIDPTLLHNIALQGTWNASSNTPTLVSSTGTQGYAYKVSVAGTTTLDGKSVWNVDDFVVFDGAKWDRMLGQNSAGVITSVAGRTGVITLAVADVSGAAPLASPTLTGTPVAPTQTAGDNSTALATTSFVTTAVSPKLASSNKAVNTDIWAGSDNSKYLTSSALSGAASFVSVAFASTVTLDMSTGDNFTIGSITSNFTLANPTNKVVGYSGCILLPINHASTVLTKGSQWLFPGGTPTPSAGSGTLDAIFYVVASSTQILCSYVKAYA